MQAILHFSDSAFAGIWKTFPCSSSSVLMQYRTPLANSLRQQTLFRRPNFITQLYSSFTRRWLSVSMKLPRDLVLLFRPNVRLPEVELSLEVAPATQKNTVARNRQAIAPQMKPKAIWPSDADWPLARKLLRPITKLALPNRQRWQLSQ